ncbi:MAG: amino acid adenylation domain-containing protein, partial [bacterium]|nr:amino acid adenylation domain-containing protein [bacterium]
MGVPNTFLEKGFGRRRHILYKTGDMARWLPDGKLEFLGRLDHQIKLRGFRIEPGEIEAVFNKHPRLRKVVVVVHEAEGEERQLVAYFTPETSPGDSSSVPDPVELRRFGQQDLPHYMIPSCFICLESFPLSPNGKIDRAVLRDRALPGDNGLLDPKEHYRGPQT